MQAETVTLICSDFTERDDSCFYVKTIKQLNKIALAAPGAKTKTGANK